MLHFAESVLFARLRTGLLCSSDQKFIFIIKLTNIDQETSKVEGAKSALPQYYTASKYRGYIGLKNAKILHARLKIVHTGLWYI